MPRQSSLPHKSAILIAEAGPLKGKSFNLLSNSSYLIGREGDIKIPEEDMTASRKHAHITFENDHFVIYDLESKNHTYVNDEMVNSKALFDGDIIIIGISIFRFILKDEEHN